MHRRFAFVVASALALLAVACSGGTPEAAQARSSESGATGSAGTATAVAPVAPEREVAGLTGWINSEPLTIAGLTGRGRVVLIDFWTYTCVNCIRTLPFLREWHEKYADRGLTILGVHSPEFEFEEVHENVVAAVERFGLTYPVAQDNDKQTWRAFENRAWPSKYLIGADGAVRYRSVGEGAYRQTEQAIRDALTDAGWDVSDIMPGEVDAQARDETATQVTRELYGGYRWNYSNAGLYAGQEEYYFGGDRETVYEDDSPHFHGRWYLQGLWRNERQAIVHARVTEAYEDYIAVPFLARSVNVVLKPSGGEPFDVLVEVDGRALGDDEAGADVVFDDAGRSILHVREPRLYSILELPAFREGELTLRSNSDDFAVFAFTFGIYTEGP